MTVNEMVEELNGLNEKDYVAMKIFFNKEEGCRGGRVVNTFIDDGDLRMSSNDRFDDDCGFTIRMLLDELLQMMMCI